MECLVVTHMGLGREQICIGLCMLLRNGDMGLLAVAPTYSVPKATLKRYLDGKNVQYMQ
jgi:hypothetical protein